MQRIRYVMEMKSTFTSHSVMNPMTPASMEPAARVTQTAQRGCGTKRMAMTNMTAIAIPMF